MYDYTYLVRTTNHNSQVIVEQYHACARPLTALRRFIRQHAGLIRDTPDDIITAVVYNKDGNIVLAGLI